MAAMLHLLLSAVLAAPQLFAPGVISGPANDGAPSFTPDGKTLFFTRSGTSAGFILESHWVNGTWTTPTIAPFSGHWNDQHAAIAPDGSFLVFTSTRPVPGIQGKVAHLWRVARTANGGWGTPMHLPPEVNVGKRLFKPSVARDGSIYFLNINDQHKFRIFVSHFVNGKYQTVQALPFSTDATADVDPEIAPDQSFMVFSSSGRKKGDTNEHLYIVRRSADGAWGDVQPLHYKGDDDNGGSNDNEPDLAPDGKTLYFSSDRTIRPKLPRTDSQALQELRDIELWNNGDVNVWVLKSP